MDHNFLWRWWRSIDQQTVIALAILFGFSLMLVTAASPAVAIYLGTGDDLSTAALAATARNLLRLSGVAATAGIICFAFSAGEQVGQPHESGA